MATKDWYKEKLTFGDEWFLKSNPKKIVYVLDDQSIYSPNMGLWYVKITGIAKKWFKTKAKALSYAKKYMRSH